MTDHDTTRLLERLAATYPERPAPLGPLVEAAHGAQRRRTRSTIALAAASCALVVAGGAAVQQSLAGDRDARSEDRVADTVPACDRSTLKTAPSSPVPQGPDFPTNAAGQTYGSGATHRPDLVAVVGDCGRAGYVRAVALDEPAPWVPGAGSGEPLTTPVYESDGVTQVDTYTQSPGTSTTSGEAERPDGPDADDVRGEWTAVIAGIRANGKDAYDTYRDLDLWIAFHGDSVQVHDGCRDVGAGFSLEDGELALTSPFDLELGGTQPDCERAAPLPEILENVRHVTREGGRTYLHLADFRIVVVLTRR